MDSAEFKIEIKKMADEVEVYLRKYLVCKDNPQKRIYEAMEYSLMCGGKRIRPVLTLAAADILGVPRMSVMPFACALEMIHTYSLIHDDLPAMDNDDLRRGMPTCHKKFDEATAILAGDALLNKAFELMAYGSFKLDNPVYGLRIISDVSCLSGTEGMIGGQVTDLESEGKKVDETVLRHTYRCKTGALLKAPVYIAAEAGGFRIVENADENACAYEECAKSEMFTKNVQNLLRYCELIGTAFQLKDDILDIEGDESELGKPIGSDVAEDKSTFVSVYGMDYCKKLLNDMTEEAKSVAASFGEKGEFLHALAIYLLERNK
ncbi:MAG: polyprenyl synthetase family protein [Clostridia bacterium]|nr:polyprenyl synthetase family protein [Clostridia bacterium]